MASWKKKFTNKSFAKKLYQAGRNGCCGLYHCSALYIGGKGFIAPSDTVYIAGIGAGGKGESDLTGFAKNPHAKIALPLRCR